MKYCPFCRSELKNGHKHQKSCSKCKYVYYNNPRPTASAIIEKDKKILLVKRVFPPFKGYWDLVGGFLDYHETPEEALRREVKEEVNLDIVEFKLFRIDKNIYIDHDTKERLSVIDHQFIVSKFKGKIDPKDDVSDARWFSINNLPPYKKIAFKNIRNAIKEYKQKKL